MKSTQLNHRELSALRVSSQISKIKAYKFLRRGRIESEAGNKTLDYAGRGGDDGMDSLQSEPLTLCGEEGLSYLLLLLQPHAPPSSSSSGCARKTQGFGADGAESILKLDAILQESLFPAKCCIFNSSRSRGCWVTMWPLL